MSEIEEEYAEASKDPTKHYDASRENRAAGAGFYQFSGNEETRARQMEELKKARQETERGRQEAGVDMPQDSLAPDAMDALAKGKGRAIETVSETSPAPAASKITGRGIDKRKRELEERRKAVEAKRRKTATATAGAAREPPVLGDNLAPISTTEHSASLSADAKPNRSMAVKPQATPPSNSADDFLAQLEADLRKG